MPDGDGKLTLSADDIVRRYFPDRDLVWFYRQKATWRDIGIAFPDPIPGTYLYWRDAVDAWFARAGSGAPQSDTHPQPHLPGGAHLDRRAERLAGLLSDEADD